LIHDPAASAAGSETNKVLSTKAHQEIARKVAEESLVLLKNEGLLPLNPAKVKTVAVIGANAVAKFASGGGAANVKAPYEITALEGISNRLGSGVTIIYAQGYNPPSGRGRTDRDDPISASPVDTNLFSQAIAAAQSADAVIYVGGLNHNGGYDTEGTDRRDLQLPSGQDQLLARLVSANPKTVAVFMGGGAVEMEPWLQKIPALLYAWYPGMEGGNALARVLFGDVSPSGKLPCTFPKRLEDLPAHALHAYPGSNGIVDYAEDLLVGYRWFDTKKVEPLFPFGYGLSYTSFEFSGLKLVPGTNTGAVIVEFEVANTGEREGAEVAQVYVQPLRPSVERPVKELKGVARVNLIRGAKQKLTLRLEPGAFAYYDPQKKSWVVEKGDYNILVGRSSRDIALQTTWKQADTITEKN
jgi:beta-glucosidase